MGVGTALGGHARQSGVKFCGLDSLTALLWRAYPGPIWSRRKGMESQWSHTLLSEVVLLKSCITTRWGDVRHGFYPSNGCQKIPLCGMLRYTESSLTQVAPYITIKCKQEMLPWGALSLRSGAFNSNAQEHASLPGPEWVSVSLFCGTDDATALRVPCAVAAHRCWNATADAAEQLGDFGPFRLRGDHRTGDPRISASIEVPALTQAWGNQQSSNHSERICGSHSGHDVFDTPGPLWIP